MWGTSPATALLIPSPQPRQGPTDWSGAWEASGSVTAEYNMGTSSTTSTAYAIDNTANKRGGGGPSSCPCLGSGEQGTGGYQGRGGDGTKGKGG